MAYKRRSSMIQGSRLHKEKLALNCAMDNTSGLDGRANSSAFQHNNHGAAEFTDNHFASGMHRTDAPGPMQKHHDEKEKSYPSSYTQEDKDFLKEQNEDVVRKEDMVLGHTGQTSDYEREFMNDMMATGQGPRKPKVGPMQEYVSDAQRKAVHASKADGGKPYKYKNGYHLPKKKTKGPYLETERDVMGGKEIAGRAALSGLATGGIGTAVSLIKNLRQRSKDKAYNAGFEQSDSDAMEL